jgi:protein arginine kinase activator
MLCQSCNAHPATVHVTEIVHPDPGSAESNGSTAVDASAPGPAIQEQHLCEGCASAAKLPQMPAVLKKTLPELYQLLQASKRQRRESSVSCPECGMTLLEFRQRGRLGCPKDYEVFAPHLRELFERIHGATRHAGRAPGLDAEAVQRIQRRTRLEQELETAIREEAYEQAARLRDELRELDPS